MKFVLIFFLSFLTNVFANTESFNLTENKSEQCYSFDQSKINQQDTRTSFNTNDVLLIGNIRSSAGLFLDVNRFSYPLLIYDSTMLHLDLSAIRYNLYTENRKIKKNLFSINCELYASNSNSNRSRGIIYWNKQNLDEYINAYLIDKRSNNNLSDYQKTISSSGFYYAGTKRYTISGKPPNKTTEINPLHASLMGAILIVTGVALHINQSAAWWDGKGRSFYFHDDWNDVLFADKIGHFLGAYTISYLAREAFVYSGFSWDQSILFGTLLGLISQTYVEFKDGYADNTGFSVSDLGADIAGAAYFYLQHYIPFLQNFSPKWQYAPASLLGVPPQATTQTFLDNYNCTTAWISVHVRNLIWGNQDSFWPKWLNIGFGYGVSGYYTTEIYSRFLIGIDYNLVELLPDGFPFWNWFKQSLNLIKLPSPAIEITKYGTKFYLLYPFTISSD